MENCIDNVFEGIPVHGDVAAQVHQYLDAHDVSPHTVRAVVLDLRKFGRWFAERNREPVAFDRVTARDLIDFRQFLRRERGQAVATCNRALSTLRSLLGWMAERKAIPANPAKQVKELRQQPQPPKGLDPAEVRRLLREVELRDDARAAAVFALMLYTGARVGDVVGLTLGDLMLGERSGHAVFRHGKGGKQRSVPLPLPARQALGAYLERRPPVVSDAVFVGERGPLTDQGVRALCGKYGAISGIRLHPHRLRHTFALRYLADNNNDLVGLAEIMGHEDVNTTRKYARRSAQQLADAAERLTY